jgi:hypothetical protein
MVNISPVGRSASNEERAEFNEYDQLFSFTYFSLKRSPRLFMTLESC